jgi:rubrerythrin
MKNIAILLGLFLAITLWSCGDTKSENSVQKEESTQAEEEAEKQGPEYTSAYICPMHCEGSGSEKPGTCPVCGMDYVKNEDAG